MANIPPISPMASEWATRRAFLPLAKLFVPEFIGIRGRSLVWRTGNASEMTPSSRMLPEFLSLANCRPERTNDDLLRFAKRWGVMQICAHQKPITHNSREDDADYFGTSKRRSCDAMK